MKTVHSVRECIKNFVNNCSPAIIADIREDVTKLYDEFILELEKEAVEELNEATHHLAQFMQILERAHAYAIENGIEFDCGRPKSDDASS